MVKTSSDIFNEGLKTIFAAAASLPEEQKEAVLKAAAGMLKAFDHVRNEKEMAEGRSLTDPLTGLPNRSGIERDLLGRLAAMQRYGNRDVAVAFIDLDGFKDINDNLGHGVGDQALCLVAERLKSRFRKSDTVARLGGDEFFLILDYEEDECFSPDTVRKHVHDALEGVVFWAGDRPFPIGASTGFAFYGRNQLNPLEPFDDTINRLIGTADQEMYADKAGKQERLAVAAAKALGRADEKETLSRANP